MVDVERSLGRDAGPPDLRAAALSPDGLPGRDVGHVIEVGDDEVGGRREDAPQAEGQVEQRRRGRLVEADLPAVPGVEEVGDEGPDPGVQGRRIGLAGGDDSGHGVEPALGVAGGRGGRVDGQTAGPGVEIDAGSPTRIPVDHREPFPDLRVQLFQGMDGFGCGHGRFLSRTGTLPDADSDFNFRQSRGGPVNADTTNGVSGRSGYRVSQLPTVV